MPLELAFVKVLKPELYKLSLAVSRWRDFFQH